LSTRGAGAAAYIDSSALTARDDDVLGEAALVDPRELRSLGAIHVASALVLGEALGVAFADDERLVDAMAAAGVPTASPS
jgi:hypothetical protein